MKNAKKRGKPFTTKNQPPNSAKRVKKKKTRIKEAVGLESWQGIAKYIQENGATKFIKELNKMRGRAFASNFLQAAEYFKPKLSRAEVTGADGADLNITVTRTIISKKV